ncbi:MAG: hypothetical protein P8Y27_02350 [Chromatiaceae bacterium]|jgi:hypothetical protein
MARDVLGRGADPSSVYPVPVGEQFVNLSADCSAVIGPDIVTVEYRVFYLGFRGSDFP